MLQSMQINDKAITGFQSLRVSPTVFVRCSCGVRRIPLALRSRQPGGTPEHQMRGEIVGAKKTRPGRPGERGCVSARLPSSGHGHHPRDDTRHRGPAVPPSPACIPVVKTQETGHSMSQNRPARPVLTIRWWWHCSAFFVCMRRCSAPPSLVRIICREFVLRGPPLLTRDLCQHLNVVAC